MHGKVKNKKNFNFLSSTTKDKLKLSKLNIVTF